MLISFMRLAQYSDSYQQVAGTQYSVSLPVGILIYGILTPFTEELLFRGVMYSRLRKYFPMPLAVMLCGLIFGCYHGNLIQILYASLMGFALAFLYEDYGLLRAPVLFHCSANGIVYILSKSSSFGFGGGAMFCGLVLLALALGITSFYARTYRIRKKHYRR
jgi:membrane protease YdiL (CAAX protease family)